ncbi:hypothetical protein K469DRAFT_442436, partial [Zopfia rhizophila CBS 207.26]
PRSHEAPVYMISSVSGVRKGRLLNDLMYLGSNLGQEMCKAWTVSSLLTHLRGLMDGDCGSIVVDQETFAIYGHSIGSNPLEHAYTVPFKHIIEQFKTTSGTSDISL